MFYENYERLCNETGEKPYALAVQLGAKNNAVVAQWKKGSVPRKAMLETIAEHFGITVGELMYGKEKQPPVSEELSEVALAIARIVDSLPEENRRLLLAQVKAVKQATEGRDDLPK